MVIYILSAWLSISCSRTRKINSFVSSTKYRSLKFSFIQLCVLIQLHPRIEKKVYLKIESNAVFLRFSPPAWYSYDKLKTGRLPFNFVRGFPLATKDADLRGEIEKRLFLTAWVFVGFLFWKVSPHPLPCFRIPCFRIRLPGSVWMSVSFPAGC